MRDNLRALLSGLVKVRRAGHRNYQDRKQGSTLWGDMMREKELEDQICKDPEKWFGESAEVIDRQIRLPHGIADLIVYRDSNRRLGAQIFVVELKVRTLAEKDIGQVLRYLYDIQSIILWSQFDSTVYQSGFRQEFYDTADSFYRGQILLSHWRPFVRPFLIGKAIDQQTLAAANGANITVRLLDGSEPKLEQDYKFTGYGDLGRKLHKKIKYRSHQDAEEMMNRYCAALMGQYYKARIRVDWWTEPDLPNPDQTSWWIE